MNSGSKDNPKAVYVTGAGGYIGSQLVRALVRDRQHIKKVVAVDLLEIPAMGRLEGVDYIKMDIRSSEQAAVMQAHGIDSVVHLASIVTPGPGMTRDFLFDVEVQGTENIVRSCLQAGVTQLVVTSSGAAYGYHADNPAVLDENDSLRGNPEFAYADHKRQVEERLAHYRNVHPELKQLIFRPGTMLGDTAKNQITALFEKQVVLGVAGAATPFVFIWDEDVVACLHKGILEDAQGIYNLAGDGTLTLKQIARRLGKMYTPLPATFLKAALWSLGKLGMTRYGPEQVGFLKYRPVLSNKRLKEEFGFLPRKTTRETFEYYLEKHGC